MRAAASSIPSGSPSRVSQISVTAAAVSGTVEPEVGPHGAGAVDEERDRVGGHATVHGERCDVEHHSPHRPPAPRATWHTILTFLDRVRIVADGRCRGREDVLAVVHHQQDLPAGQRLGHGVDERRVALRCDAEDRRDRGRDGRRVADRRQVHQPHAVGELAGHLGADLEREPGLADPADAAQRDEPARPHRFGHLGNDVLATDE